MMYYLIPEYIEGLGDGTRVKSDEGEILCTRNIKSSLKDLYKDKCVDFRVIKRKCSRILNQKNLIPLYLSLEETLIPVKVRRPKVLRDGGYGYVNLHFVEKIDDGVIILKDGTRIFFIDSLRSIIKRVKMARILDDAFKDKGQCYEESKINLKEPATKEDISLLLGEIAHLKRKLEEII